MLIAALALCACSLGDGDSSVDSQTSLQRCRDWIETGVPCDLPIGALLATPERYEGRDVAFIGFLAGGGVPGVVYPTREQWLARDKASSIRLTIDEADFAKWVRAEDTKYTFVQVQGRLDPIGGGRQPNVHVRVVRLMTVRNIETYSESELKRIEEERHPQ